MEGMKYSFNLTNFVCWKSEMYVANCRKIFIGYE